MSELNKPSESSLAIYGDEYVVMEEIRLQQPGALPESIIAKEETDFALSAVEDILCSRDRVLDCPCGLGAQAICLSEYRSPTVGDPGLQITAIDGSCALIDVARNKSQSIQFHEGDVRNIKSVVGSESQKAVFVFKESFGLLDSLEENIDHLKAMFDVLVEGGRMVLTWNFNPDEADNEKIETPFNGTVIRGLDKEGKKIGCYVSVNPPEKADEIVPENYIPSQGFEELRRRQDLRTIRSLVRREYVLINSDGSETRSGQTETRKYFNPVFEKNATLKNASIENRSNFYDLPLLRALCQYAGFVHVHCIPAKPLKNGLWVGGIVAEKPEKQPGISAVDEGIMHFGRYMTW